MELYLYSSYATAYYVKDRYVRLVCLVLMENGCESLLFATEAPCLPSVRAVQPNVKTNHSFRSINKLEGTNKAVTAEEENATVSIPCL